MKKSAQTLAADETIETLAAIETLNSVIDTYNQYHDFTVETRSSRNREPYFAKVALKMRLDVPSRDVYIGAAGITDKDVRRLLAGWRSPVETYYNQMGTTSYR